MKLLNKISTPNINVVETTFQKKHFLETKKYQHGEIHAGIFSHINILHAGRITFM